MATQEEKIEGVKAGAAEFAKFEVMLDNAEKECDELLNAITDVYELGVGTHGEYLVVSNRIKHIKGTIAGALATTISVHRECTDIAKREDCDAGVPDQYAITGGVTVMSGGR